MNQTVNKTGIPVTRVLPTRELNARRRRKRTLTQGKPSDSAKVGHTDRSRSKDQT